MALIVEPQTTQEHETHLVLSALSESKDPCTLRKIEEKLRHGLRGAELKQLVERLVREGKLFQCSPKRGAARYWDRDEKELARKAVVSILAAKPLTQNQVVDKLGPKLGTNASRAWHLALVKDMLAGGRLFLWPKLGRYSDRLAVEPPDPIAYVKKFTAELNKVCKSLEKAGVPTAKTVSAITELLMPSATKSDGGKGEDHEGTELILKGMLELEPDAEIGALVSVRQLRELLSGEFKDRIHFDGAILKLVDEGSVVLHRHSNPSHLSEETREQLLRDSQGNFYVGVAKRV